MKAVIVGVVVGLVVFLLLLVAFASGTGPIELLLWLALAVLSGAVAAKVSSRSTKAQP
jgi:hypothetical protein